MEIERKFLIDSFPEGLPLLEEATVYQGYLAVDPVVRIRSKETDKGKSFILCFKGDGTIARQETELEITEAVFRELKALLKHPLVRKDYKIYALPGGERLECSLVDRGTPTEFYYAEVEFRSIEQANAFQPPAFLKKDVTEDRSYSMGNYWARKYAAEPARA